MFNAFALYIAVIINGQVWEAIPVVYETETQCLSAQEMYKDIVIDSHCFKGTFVNK